MDFIKKYHKYILLFLPVVSFLLHWYVFDLDLVGIHVWRQTKTQQVINNFYREDMNIFHPRCNNMMYTDRLLLQEFPIMQWLFALFYKVFGNHIVISRLLSFLVGVFSIYGMFHLAKRVFNNLATATVCAWCFAFSPVFYYYMVNPMPDNFSMCFGIWSVAIFYDYIHTSKLKYIWLSAVCMSIAVMAKLPFIMYGAVMIAYFIAALVARKETVAASLKVAAIYIFVTAPALVWYAAVIHTWEGNVILSGMTAAEQSWKELAEILNGVLVSMLPELLINYGSVLFFVAGFYFMFRFRVYTKRYFSVLLVFGLVTILYFLFEMNAITTVHDYYMFPLLPPMFLLVAYGAAKLLESRFRGIRVLSIICLAVLPITAFVRAYSRWDVATDAGFAAVFYNYKDEIRNLTPKDALCIVGNDQSDMVLLYYIDRKGWCFDNDQIDEPFLSSCMESGATYLYLTGNADDNPEIRKYLAEKIFEKESLRVYKLKH